MKLDPQFTAKLQEFLNTPDAKKDWAEGAVMLLQLSGNQIMYRNISMNPKGKAEFIKGQLQKYLNFRLQQLTHDEVEEMQKQVDTIVKSVIKPNVPADASQGSVAGQGSAGSQSSQVQGAGKSEEFAEFKAGKRADHEMLPDEVKVLYAENLDIVHRMRELHLKLRSLSLDNATCPDSERYPFLKEIIALDKKLHENWDAYDHYVVGQDIANGSESPSETEEDAPEDAAPEDNTTSEAAPEDAAPADAPADAAPTSAPTVGDGSAVATPEDNTPAGDGSPVIEKATAKAAKPAAKKATAAKRTTKKASKKQ
jgi:hypothetical protein